MNGKRTSFLNKLRAGLPIALIVLGAVFGILATGLWIHNKDTQPEPPNQALTSKAAPSSVKPTAKAVANYSVPATDPKYLTIPTIGISQTRILKLGLTSANQIAVPDNIYNTGWYDGSAEPGQTGAMFIYGHVSSWTANGVFYNLKKLVAGNKITVTRGDNTDYTYQVISTKIYPYNNVDMTQVLAPIEAGKPGLNLMTCTGEVIKGTSEFNERLVVFTSLVTT